MSSIDTHFTSLWNNEAIKLTSREIEVAFLKEVARWRRLTETAGNTVTEDAEAVTVVAVANAD